MLKQQRILGPDFRQRFLTAVIGGPLILLAVAVGWPLFHAVVCLVAIICGIELQRMIHPDSRAGIIITLLMILACIAAIVFRTPSLILVAAVIFVIVGLVETRLLAADQPYGYFFGRYYFYLLIGALYIGLPLGVLTLIRDGENGLLWTAMLFINNWGTDGFALIGGRIAGRHKLVPRISPSKTVEGALIGLTVGFLSGLCVALLGGIPFMLALVANIAVAVSVEIGDLIESWVKRRLAVKDSGSILPGHGGFLDRVDGTLLAVPVLYLILRLFS